MVQFEFFLKIMYGSKDLMGEGSRVDLLSWDIRKDYVTEIVFKVIPEFVEFMLIHQLNISIMLTP